METNIDKNVLKILKYRIHFEQYHKVYNPTILHKNTKLILKAYKAYFREYPYDKIKYSGFWTFFKQMNSGTPKIFDLLEEPIKNALAKDVSESELMYFSNTILEENAVTDVMNIIHQWKQGDEIEVIPELYEIIEDAILEQTKEDKLKKADLSVDDFLALNSVETGLQWHLECLNRAMRPLRQGDHVLLAARIDSGKTSFLLDQVAYMASQLPEGKIVKYFGNEDSVKTLQARVLSLITEKSYEALGKDRELVRDTLSWVKSKIEFIEFHGRSTIDAEKELRKGDIGLVVFDLLDHVNLSKAVGNKVEDIEALYNWARAVAHKYAPVISCGQADVTAEGEMYLGMHQLHYSKTGKQGTADAIIMLGRSADESMDNLRGITVPKNKLRMQSSPSNAREEIQFNKITGRFLDI